ncbi:hypothetical protein LX87_03929 [Larkinella arboricola]|uniref:Uncharacterized protein n=1 Tax=Larkinella arboricola TaxID=643671 RepID=A0A327WX20_LARAB|nr:hypothetical protein [Larkinella arboricola]RAJ94045.1 hypothetical protein LX87_03929 [Larkinella arboricola]
MATQQPTELIHTTISALNDGGVTSIVPVDGLSLIDNWLETLDDSAGNQQVVTSLQELKSQLESDAPDPVTVKTILLDLSEQLNVQASNSDASIHEPLRDLSNAILTLATSL